MGLNNAMKYIILFLLLFATPVMAQIMVDDGIRSPKNMMVSGESVIDDGPIEDQVVGEEVMDSMSEENKETFKDGMEDVKMIAPIPPTSPSAPKPKVKQVIKPTNEMKIRRSIADDRIDDGYVQEMVKDNFMFTPDYKDKRKLP